MIFIDEFRDKHRCKILIDRIKEIVPEYKVNIMEVCGTHTVAIFKYGLKDMLPDNISLISGPGCPVCVTHDIDIIKAMYIARMNNVILATFGDMLRVPINGMTLEEVKAEGRDVRIIYSPMDVLDIAENNKDKLVVLLGIGFETTAPCIATALLEAKKRNIKNMYVLSCCKLIPPAMKALVDTDDINIHGFICPGHVSTIIGMEPYRFIPEEYNVPCVIAGFEPVDILQAIFMILRQIVTQNICVEIQYKRSVQRYGNTVAQEIINQVFEPVDTLWRGIGMIPDSGLKIKEEYQYLDVQMVFKIPDSIFQNKVHDSECICGDILRGIAIPYDCVLFGNTCTPLTPVGPCMVSTEGSCAAYYKYSRR
jgi:hydrogenase expression/formation protein HypD